MGNNQFGFAIHPPEFIGKSWNYVKQNKTKSIEILNKDQIPSRLPDNAGCPISNAASLCGGDAWKPLQRTATAVRRTRSMRCSPTVPDTLNLTVGIVNNLVIGASSNNATPTAS